MFKKYFVICILFVFSFQSIFALTAYHYSASYNAGSGGLEPDKKYLDVIVYCQPKLATLYCFNESQNGNYCSFLSATEFWWCDYLVQAYDDALVENMFDHAKNQITLDIYNGTYTKNLMVSPSGKKWGRTVTWSADTTTYQIDIDVDITEIP